jgi:hypothetical protein
MGAACVFLVLLVTVAVVLVILIVLKRLAQVHLHAVGLVARAPIHDIVALVPVRLIEHGELLWRLAPWRSRGRGSVGVVERYSGGGG